MTDKKDDKVEIKYIKQYSHRVGKIEGGDDMLVEIVMISPACIPSVSASYGCKSGERALLVDWIPAGMQHTDSGYLVWPEETRVDKSKIPPENEWVVFPKTFENLAVYYKRGTKPFLG